MSLHVASSSGLLPLSIASSLGAKPLRIASSLGAKPLRIASKKDGWESWVQSQGRGLSQQTG